MASRFPGFFEGTGMPDPGWWEALWPDPAKVLMDVGVTPGMDVADLCSGDGWFTFPLSRIARSVIAIDIDAALLEAAKVRIAERGGASNCTFVEADAYNIAKVVPHAVDHVFLANAFHGVPDKPRLARAVHDILKARWFIRYRELVRAAAGANDCSGGAARASDGTADDAGSDHR
jgi:SAM-dependent methyltransferase